jgi:hypothetical protein
MHQFVSYENFQPVIGIFTIGVGRIKKGCHAEALEACGQRPLRSCFECLSMTPLSFL